MIGSDGRVRLIDFGIADLIGNTRDQILGTPGYASPEVRAGQAPTQATDVYGLALIARELLGPVALDPRVALVLRFGLFESPSRRPSSAGRFALALTTAVRMRELAIQLREVGYRLPALRTPRLPSVAPLRAFAAALRRPSFGTSGRKVAYATVAIVLTALVLALPRLTSALAGSERLSGASGAAAYALPPLSAYAAAYEWQAPYPTAVAGTEALWVVGLRNTGTAGWFSDRPGAQAALILEDGRVVATPSVGYVAPGEVAIFNVRFMAPAETGVRTYPMRLYILGSGLTPSFGLYANLTVTEPRSTIGGRH
jgi:hypothetical protein